MSTVIKQRKQQKKPNKKKGVKRPAAKRLGKPKQRRPIGRRGLGEPRGLPGQRIERTGLLTSRNAPMLNRRMGLEEDEYIGDVSGSVGFTCVQYAVNPGQPTTFPWGNKIAQLYEEYDFEYLEFYITSEVSGYATQGQTGVVIMSFDYDASDPAPTTKQQVESTNPHTTPCLPSTSVIRLTVDCKNSRVLDGKFVRPGALPANTDIKTYDIGNLNVSTQGQANTTVFGELHVRYKCWLKQQVLEPATVVGGVLHFSSIASTTANNFAAAVLQSGGTPSLTGITLGTNTVVFPAGIPGNYLLALAVAGATSASAFGSVVDTPINLLTQSGVRDTVGSYQSLSGTTSSPAMQLVTCTVPTAGTTVTLTASTIVGTGSMDLFIVSLPSTVLTATLPLAQLCNIQTELTEFKEQLAHWKRHFNSVYVLEEECEERKESDTREESAPSSAKSSASQTKVSSSGGTRFSWATK